VAFAAALITGERSRIMDETNQAMRHSGLFHVLRRGARTQALGD
jgi:predicted membrane metal-binding protein